MCKLFRFAGILALMAMLAWLDAATTRALAQAGSTGGTIGKTDKSASGGQDASQARSRSSAEKESLSLPQLIHLSEHSTSADYSCTLRNVGGNTYQGTWNVPVISTMTVTLTSGSLTIQRQDIGGFSRLYQGKRSGNAASGSLSSPDGSKATWHATW